MHRLKKQLANISLILLALFYLIMLGGGSYEHMNVATVVASAPPKSLAMMQGVYGFNPVTFWVTFRPLTILLFGRCHHKQLEFYDGKKKAPSGRVCLGYSGNPVNIFIFRAGDGGFGKRNLSRKSYRRSTVPKRHSNGKTLTFFA